MHTKAAWGESGDNPKAIRTCLLMIFMETQYTDVRVYQVPGVVSGISVLALSSILSDVIMSRVWVSATTLPQVITLLLQGHSEVEIHLKCTPFFEYEIHHVTVRYTITSRLWDS